jgi:hypothetical protein
MHKNLVFLPTKAEKSKTKINFRDLFNIPQGEAIHERPGKIIVATSSYVCFFCREIETVSPEM